MVRLSMAPREFGGLTLKQCGLLFLSTPHSGTTGADWSDLLMNLSETTLGIRSHAIIDQLRSFNPSSVDSVKAFAGMESRPPFYCLCEGKKTMVAGRARMVIYPRWQTLGILC